jgi:hypothetical protein
MDENRNIHEVADDILQDFHDPLEEDPVDDFERKALIKEYRKLEQLRRKQKF